MTKVFLIRHARPRSAWGEAEDDPGLDDLGWTQARLVADRFARLDLADRPTRVVSSPLRRCRETAAPTAEALGVAVEIDPVFGEVPTPVSLPVSGRSEWLSRAMQGAWTEIVGDLDYDAWRRAAAAAVGRYPRAAIFSHFVAINGVLSTITGDTRVISHRPDHASVITLRLGGPAIDILDLGVEAATDVL